MKRSGTFEVTRGLHVCTQQTDGTRKGPAVVSDTERRCQVEKRKAGNANEPTKARLVLKQSSLPLRARCLCDCVGTDAALPSLRCNSAPWLFKVHGGVQRSETLLSASQVKVAPPEKHRFRFVWSKSNFPSGAKAKSRHLEAEFVLQQRQRLWRWVAEAGRQSVPRLVCKLGRSARQTGRHKPSGRTLLRPRQQQGQ